MQSLFQADGAAETTRRIHSLTHESPAHWGKMNVLEMLHHCNRGMDMSLGKLTLKRSMAGRILGGLFKRLTIGNDKPFSKNLPTDPNLLQRAPEVEPEAFGAAQAQLVAAVEEFHSRGASGVPAGPHPFFGKLSPAQWDNLAAKHLDHHLRQFGSE